ncbi:hypothetical protein BHE74_00020663 [Ensete ventricosum]|nr:hypothetical protein BHE74_00020663 [Ensete ventricosum]RZS02923.1 hypothetical protein BHM03_00033037 [Ensete ventricosum]
MRIAVGAARGLAFIHQASRSPKLTHGNIKATNILLDKEGNARVADAGLALLGPGAAAVGRAGGYRAPEAPSDGRRPWASQRADAYAFGVVLLELLTGKPAADGGASAVDLPRWVQSVVREEWTAEVFDLELMRYKGIEEEIVAMLQIAMSCTAVVPDQRPNMSNVVKMIENIHGGGAGGDLSPFHDSFDSNKASSNKKPKGSIHRRIAGHPGSASLLPMGTLQRLSAFAIMELTVDEQSHDGWPLLLHKSGMCRL